MSAWTLGKLTQQDQVASRLVQAGLTASTAISKAACCGALAATIIEHGIPKTRPAIACFVPGRIEVLGKHTDYMGGRSLVAACERGFAAVAVPRDDATIHMTDIRDERETTFPLTADLNATVGDWSNYPKTVARRIARNFTERVPKPLTERDDCAGTNWDINHAAHSGSSDRGPLRGAEIAFASDLPPAAGMSSSSALIVLTFLVLSHWNELPNCAEYAQDIRSVEDLAGYLGTIENGQSFGRLTGDQGVGTFGGSEDHTAILCSSVGTLAQYSYCPVRHERQIGLSADHVFALASSGIAAEKTGAAMARYNRASALASTAAAIWRDATGRDDPHLAAALVSAPDAVERIRNVLRTSEHPPFEPADLVRRFEHFWAESEEIIPAVTDRLEGHALTDFGALVDRSQALGAELLGNQVPETIALATLARELGAVAASAFGAGFGGSVWALIHKNCHDQFLERWTSRYRAAFPERADAALFFSSPPGPAAFVIAD